MNSLDRYPIGNNGAPYFGFINGEPIWNEFGQLHPHAVDKILPQLDEDDAKRFKAFARRNNPGLSIDPLTTMDLTAKEREVFHEVDQLLYKASHRLRTVVLREQLLIQAKHFRRMQRLAAKHRCGFRGLIVEDADGEWREPKVINSRDPEAEPAAEPDTQPPKRGKKRAKRKPVRP